jgi:hypothetical protein
MKKRTQWKKLCRRRELKKRGRKEEADEEEEETMLSPNRKWNSMWQHRYT